MKTEVLKLDGSSSDQDALGQAVRFLHAGELVAFPTETVYGLGADARNPEALARLSQVKGRPAGKPFSLLIPSVRHAEELAGGLSRAAQKLARLYWPGPLTLVLPRPGGGTVGLRLPEHPATRLLLAQFGGALAAPSANKSGHPEPLTAEQVRTELDGEIPLILDGGPTPLGQASVVVGLDAEDKLRMHRAGAIAEEEIAAAVRPTVLFVCTGNTCRSPMAQAFFQEFWQDSPHASLARSEPRVLSAGTAAPKGQGADPLAIEVMREVQVDLRGHRTQPLHPRLLDEADWVFTMTHAHRQVILELMPESRERVRLLSSRHEDIPDPASREIEQYRHVRNMLAPCVHEVFRGLGKALR